MHQTKTKLKLKKNFRVQLFQLNCHGNLFRLYAVIIFFMVITTTHSQAQDDRSHHISPQLIQNPSAHLNYTPESRQFTGIPSLAITEKGRMFAVWYAGITPGEDLNNYVVVAKSDNMGHTWEEILVIDPDGTGPVRSYDPEVWIDPDGKLWIFWAQAAKASQTTWALITEGTSAGVWALTVKDPDKDNIKWPEPKRLTDGVMMCKPTVLSDGEWALPVSIWRMKEGSAQIVISGDRGKTWQVRGAADVPADVRRYDEHMIVERNDGSLWMLVRTRYGIGESISNDRGRTWSSLVPSDIQHPSARFFIRCLNSGNLLLVKHGPITMQTERSHLMAFISKDDGHSWSQGLLLDGREGVSYPDGQQTKDGNIYIIYDYNRRSDQNILMTSFTEDDVVPCSAIKMVEVFQRRRVVSKGGSR